MVSPFFYSKNCSRSVLSKVWRLLTVMAASACKITEVCGWLPVVQVHYFSATWPPIAYKFCQGGRQSRTNCSRVAASRAQIVPGWPPVACKMSKVGGHFPATGGHPSIICHGDWLPDDREIMSAWHTVACQFACDWWPPCSYLQSPCYQKYRGGSFSQKIESAKLRGLTPGISSCSVESSCGRPTSERRKQHKSPLQKNKQGN
jgi:hypothetical protein